MYDDGEFLKTINKLLDIYKYRWGKELDMAISPPWLGGRELIVVLERIIDTGESILVGYNRIIEEQPLNKT